MTDRARLLDALLADPARATAISPEERTSLIAALSALVIALVSVPLPTPIAQLAREPEQSTTPNVLLTPAEAAARMGIPIRRLYRDADRFSFTRRLGARTLRFDARGLERWLASRRP